MRRLVLWFIGLCVVAGAAYYGWWEYLAMQVRDALEPWADSRRAEGLDVAWDDVHIDGFPFALRLTFTNYRASGLKPLPFSVSGATVAFWSAPWDLHLWRFEAKQGARLEAILQSAGFDAQNLSGAVRVPFASDGTLDLAATGLSGSGIATGFSAAQFTASLTQPLAPPASERDPYLLASVAVTDLGLPAAPPPFGTTIQELSVSAAIKGAVIPGPLPQSLDAWRQAGGTLDVTSLRLRWDALDIRAKGTAALDDKLQPIGALTALIHGQNELVDAAVSTGMLKPDAAQLAKAVLGMVAQPDAGGQPQVTLPISAQNQKVYLGPAPVARIPLINWE